MSKTNFYHVTLISIKMVIFFLLSSSIVLSQTSGSFIDKFSQFDPNSALKINHLPLSEFLNETVFPVGNSKGKLGSQGRTEKHTASRIVRSSSGDPSRYEGNRLMIHAFNDDHEAFLEGYQEGLEVLSLRRSLSTLNKDEQLAYWLNLYNVIVLNKLIDEYPIKKLKSLRTSKKQQPFWNEKVTTVEGISLSLRDIERIVFANWDSPLVMYGFFQGSVGGPSLPTEAYTGTNVWDLLRESAVEFVNSNRGLRVKGSRADVSLMYEWALPLFDNSKQQVLAHIKNYANSNFHGELPSVQDIRFKTYNWIIADLVGGTLHKGQHNQLGVY